MGDNSHWKTMDGELYQMKPNDMTWNRYYYRRINELAKDSFPLHRKWKFWKILGWAILGK